MTETGTFLYYFSLILPYFCAYPKLKLRFQSASVMFFFKMSQRLVRVVAGKIVEHHGLHLFIFNTCIVI